MGPFRALRTNERTDDRRTGRPSLPRPRAVDSQPALGQPPPRSNIPVVIRNNVRVLGVLGVFRGVWGGLWGGWGVFGGVSGFGCFLGFLGS